MRRTDMRLFFFHFYETMHCPFRWQVIKPSLGNHSSGPTTGLHYGYYWTVARQGECLGWRSNSRGLLPGYWGVDWIIQIGLMSPANFIEYSVQLKFASRALIYSFLSSTAAEKNGNTESIIQGFCITRTAEEMTHPKDSRQLAAQDVGVGNINPAKLAEKLRSTFGSGSFEIYVGNPLDHWCI
jgi:hypothetical protein